MDGEITKTRRSISDNEVTPMKDTQNAGNLRRSRQCFRVMFGKSTDFIIYGNLYLFSLLFISTFGIALFSFLEINGLALHCTSFFLLLYAPLTLHQTCSLSKMKSLRGYMNDLRRKVNDVMIENEILEYRAEYCREKLQRMDPFEPQSANLKSEDIVQLVEIINEQAKVKQQIENLAHESVYQQMLSTVLRENKSNDLIIKPKEFQHILIRLEYQSGLYFHKDKFVRLVRKNCREDGDIPVETIASILRDYHDSQKDAIRSSRRIFSSDTISITDRNEVRKKAKRTLIFKRRKQ